MTADDIGEAETTTPEASVPKRHDNWRKDWERVLYWPEYESGSRRWNILH
jgi:hypothetical protein